MEIKDFYDFSEKLYRTTLHAEPINLSSERDSNGLNSVIRLLIGDYRNIVFPVIFKQAFGKRLDDVIRTGTAILYLISDRMRSVLEQNNLTGWKTFPVKVLNKKGEEINGYHGFSITGRCGPIDNSKGEIIEKQYFTNGPIVKFRKGLHIGLDKWDGSDFFIPEKYYGIMATKKATDVLKHSKLTNIELENLAEKEIHLGSQ